MTYYFKRGNKFSLSREADLDLHEQLPAGNYIIKVDNYGQFYFEQVDSFVINHKLYGLNPFHTERILNTFLDRDSSTGVLLTGEKGSGKSLLAKTVSIAAAKLGIPTVIVNSPYYGDDFSKLVQDIEQPCVIIFDEFEKVYDEEQQNGVLTLLDGVFPSKKLFILTCNDRWRISQHMRNRPGRIYYAIDFTGIDHEFIVDYCDDNLQYLEYTDQICKIATMFAQFNFDMLKAVVEEINRYSEPPQQALKMLNTKPEQDDNGVYDVEILIDNQPIAENRRYDTIWQGNPLSHNVSVDYYIDDSRDEYQSCKFTPTNLVSLSPSLGQFVFVNNQNQRVILTRQKAKLFDYLSVL